MIYFLFIKLLYDVLLTGSAGLMKRFGPRGERLDEKRLREMSRKFSTFTILSMRSRMTRTFISGAWSVLQVLPVLPFQPFMTI